MQIDNVVTKEMLARLAVLKPQDPKQEYQPNGFKPLDLEDWMTKHSLSVRRTKSWQGGTVYVLSECPFNPEHNSGEARIIRFSNGALSAGCFHKSCQDWNWHTLREELAPGWSERKSPPDINVVVENGNPIKTLREIAKLKFASERELELKKFSDSSGITLSALKDDLKRLRQEEESKPESQRHSKPEMTPIDLIAEPKPSLHPAMDLIDGDLAYGTAGGGNSLLIHARNVLDLSAISKSYEITNPPQPNRFSVYGIKTYINGAEIRGPKLYKKIRDLLCKYIIFKELWQSYLITLWIIGTYLHRCFPLYPYLWIQSITKRCAKSRLLELLSELSFNSNGIATAPTEAVLYRVPAITAGTLCWDEAENLHNHKEKGERLSILNVAYRKGGSISRCEGESHEVRAYEVFRPIAFAGISSLPDTTADRALKIELIRKRKDEKVERLQLKHLQRELQSLRDGLHIFALERTPIILEAYSQFRDDLIPEGVDDRLRDALEILFSIAAGIYRYDTSDFPSILSYLQDAARALGGIRTADEDDTTFIRAINILKSKMEENKQQKLILTSQEAVNVLKEGGLDWITEPKDARKVLRRLGCSSGTHRKEEEVIRGYVIEKERLEDLFQRYGGTFAE